MEAKVREAFEKITHLLIKKNSTVTTMESCTSGLIASLITYTEGASAILKGAFVTYSNEAKIRQGVPEEVIRQYGVYSGETAAAMAEACRNAYDADIGIGVTGSYGNVDPNNADSVPGEVFFAIAAEGKTQTWRWTLPLQPSRAAYKFETAGRIAEQLLRFLEYDRRESADAV